MWGRGGLRPPSLEVGGSFGGYTLDGFLGEGGMAVVYRATRTADGATVALKVLKGQFSGDSVYRRRFLHEARAASEVRHPNLVPLLDAGDADGHPYLAVALIEGRTLEQRIEHGPLTREEIVRLATEVGAGLDALHAHGLVHRDVKPSNILLDLVGAAALTDFGLAKGEGYSMLTSPGQVMGTIDYLAPELILGSPASSTSDIYALGCVVFECTTGRAPFADRSVFQVGVAHLQDDPPDPCAGRPELPTAFGAAVLSAMAKDPLGRPPTASAFAESLRAAAR